MLVIFWIEHDICLISDCKEYIQQQTFQPMKKWKILLTQQIHSSSEEFLNEKPHMVCVPFSRGSIRKYGIYVIDNIGVFATLSNI